MADEKWYPAEDKFVYDLTNGDETMLSSIRTTFTDAVEKDGRKPKALVVELAASHIGYVNDNHYFYTTEDTPESIKSFTEPFEKPVLINHDHEGDALGRVKNANYLELDFKDASDITEPKGLVQLSVRVTDQAAIEKILDERYLTVSVGSRSQDAVCSLCNRNFSTSGICEHKKGKKYGGKLAYVKIGKREYKDVSFVNVPADRKGAGVTGTKFEDARIAHLEIEYEDAVIPEETAEEQGTPQFLDAKEDKVEDFLKDIDTYELSAEDAEEIGKVLDSMLDEELADAKLSSEKRNSLPSGSFCGPDRSFPVPDCAHVTAARRLVGRSKLSAAGKAKVLACVARKAKSMSCSTGDASDLTPQDLFDQWVEDLAFIAELQDELKTLRCEKDTAEKALADQLNDAVNVEDLQKKNIELTDSLTSKDDEIGKLVNDNAALKEEMHRDLAARLVDMKITLRKPGVENVLGAKQEDRAALREEKITEHTQRDTVSLRDSIQDLVLEIGAVKTVHQAVDSEGIAKPDAKRVAKPSRAERTNKVLGIPITRGK